MRIWITFWLLLITLLSLAPFRVKWLVHSSGILHYAGHLVVFAITGVMVLSSATGPAARVHRIVLLFLYCAALEWLQTRMYHIRIEWADLLVDSFAVAISPFLLYLLPNRDRKGVVSR